MKQSKINLSRLRSWTGEVIREINQSPNQKENISKIEKYTILPKRFYEKTREYSQEKKYDFCFLGSRTTRGRIMKKRFWIYNFIKTFFNENSYLKFTDQATIKDHKTLGSFDYTNKIGTFNYCPKEQKDKSFFDEDYYKIMCASKFCLCPAGDDGWSNRFYEALMCKAIPIIYSETEKCRTPDECVLNYKFYLVDKIIENETCDFQSKVVAGDKLFEKGKSSFSYNNSWARHNYEIFLKYHTYEDLTKNIKT